MPESYWNEASNTNEVKNEIFSQLQVPLETPFFVRLDGRRFQAVAEKLHVDKPFDQTFAKCLVVAGKTLFKDSLNPALIYVASDEISRQQYHKHLADSTVTRWRTKENWHLPMFTSQEGKNLIQCVLKWAKPHKIKKE